MKRVSFLLFILSLSSVAFSQDTTRVSLLFAGDIMQHDSQIRAAWQPEKEAYNYAACFQYIKPIIESADIAIGNLELTLAGPPYKGYPQFSAPDQLAEELKNTGFDVLVTANNHCVDRRSKGLKRTIDVLDSLQILHTGTFKDTASREVDYPMIAESKGIRFSLLNYTYGTNGVPVAHPTIVNLIDTVAIGKDLEKAASQKTDIKIVFMHWGAEYQDSPNQFQKRVAEFCLRNGAQLVIGSHPHVLQPMEWNKPKNQLVAYSLGNFVSGQQSRYRDGGTMLWVDLEKISTDSTSETLIRNASYDLEWVYRNNESPKKYFILPVKEFESDTITLANKIAQANFEQFVKDSRKLFTANKDVKETQRLKAETTYYKVLLSEVTDSVAVLDSIPLITFFGISTEPLDEERKAYLVGKFFDLETAQQALAEIVASTPYKASQIVQYYWGRRLELLSRKEDSN